MKRLLVAAVGLASLGFASASVPATAADIAPRRMAPVSAPAYLPFNWGGWYAGLNLGGGVGGDVDGIIFGGQIGYNWQVNQIVFGIETDLHYSGQDDTRSPSPAGLPPRISTGSAPSAAASASRSGIAGCPTSPAVSLTAAAASRSTA